MERFQKIRKSRPQDSKAHETFNFLLFCFEGKPIMATNANTLYALRKEADRIREIELNRERELSTTRSKLYSDVQEP